MVEFKIAQEKYPDELFPGEGIVVSRGGSIGLILCCPKCGYTATGPHDYNKETKTLSPSIGCGNCLWHGYLRGGLFINA